MHCVSFAAVLSTVFVMGHPNVYTSFVCSKPVVLTVLYVHCVTVGVSEGTAVQAVQLF
jgi:hypothetical protein